MTLTIVADDLTGACDSGALFAGKGPVPVTVWPADPVDAPVRVVDTETRGVGPGEATERVRRVAATAGRCFKKIDSTLRGHIGVEVSALLAAVGAPGALLCPAFPAQGRVVVDRVLLIDGVPLAETTLARDPAFPTPASNVLDLLRPSIDCALAWIPITEVRGPVARLAERLGRLVGTVAVADAESHADLDALVAAVARLDRPPLLVGSAGLARALAHSLGLATEPPALPAGRRWLVVAGSRHPVTRAQVATARAAGVPVLAAPEPERPDRARVAADLAAKAARLLEREPFDALAVTGGDTAVALYRALGAERVDLLGAPAPGLALGHLRAPRRPPLPVLTKAGGFGDAALFVRVTREGRA